MNYDPTIKQNISTEKAPNPVGAYPHAKKVGPFLFLSGMGPRQPQTKEIPGVELSPEGRILSYNITEQTEAVFKNLKNILEASNASMEKVVDVQVFLTNMKDDFKEFNRIYGSYFDSSSGPTRTTVEVRSLPTPIAVELKVIAFLG